MVKIIVNNILVDIKSQNGGRTELDIEGVAFVLVNRFDADNNLSLVDVYSGDGKRHLVELENVSFEEVNLGEETDADTDSIVTYIYENLL